MAAKIDRRPLALLLAGVLTLVAIVTVSVFLASETRSSAVEVQAAHAARGLSSQILIATVDAETGQRGYLLTGETLYLAPYDAARARLPELLAQFRKLATTRPEMHGLVLRIDQLVNAKLAELAETIKLAKAKKLTTAITVVHSNRGKKIMDDLRLALDQLSDVEDVRVAQRVNRLESDARTLIMINVIGGALTVLFGGAAFWLAVRYNRRLEAATHETENLNASLEQRVTERTLALSHANDEVQRFAYIVSHDLRAPLVNIMGFTAELEVSTAALQHYFTDEKPEDSAWTAARNAVAEDLPEAVHFIRTSTAKMDRLINAILRLSREGRRELTAEPIDLMQMFQAAAESLRHQAMEANARIELPSFAPRIRSDRLALEQIISNLLDNAVKYLSSDRPGLITIDARDVKELMVITIRDNGRGIAPQDHERIFELFRRAGAQDRQGEGIGLAHVRSLVRRLGGDITVESALGQGTAFHISLPRSLRIS
ncbi:MAG: GHKL domain-containing protein [Beijerinckiaceae bacterium]|nr:MAG: GHKL domain-containing protein [Beijerinckiaceae bacterium]